MEQEKKVNYAEIARVYNISYSMLYKKVHAGISLEDAIAICEQARDARLISGQLRAPRSNLSPITFNGTTYSSFADACHAFGLSAQTGYMQRKRIMDKEFISNEDASLRVLQAAAEQTPKRRPQKPVTVFGITCGSQEEAAQKFGISIGSISAKRAREHLSAGEAIESLLRQRQSSAELTYDPPFLDQKWEDFKSSLKGCFPNTQECSGILTASYQLPDGPSVSCEISMPNAQCLSFRFKDLDFIPSREIIGLSAAYCGIKFIFNEYGQMEALSDIFLDGHLKTDIKLAQNAWRHCRSVLSKIYLSKRNL